MTGSQTILFTLMPRGVSLNPETLPVSVFVSPRLSGESHLGAFPDWLNWTARLQELGLSITFECNGQTLTMDISKEPLREELWRELFKEDTLVRSHQFDDYSQRFIASYPVRAALSSLKGMYQAAGIALALPEIYGEGHAGRQRALRGLIDGFQLDWDEAKGHQWRAEQRSLQRGTVLRAATLNIQPELLGSETHSQ